MKKTTVVPILKFILMFVLLLTCVCFIGCSENANSSSIVLDETAISKAENSQISSTATVTPTNTPAIPAKITAQYATDDVLSQYSDYHTFEETLSPEYATKIIITTDTPITLLTYSEATMDFPNDTEYQFNLTNELYSLAEFTPEKPIVITTIFEGTLPTRALTVVEKDGTYRIFSLTQSGKDGSIILTQEESQAK